MGFGCAAGDMDWRHSLFVVNSLGRNRPRLSEGFWIFLIKYILTIEYIYDIYNITAIHKCGICVFGIEQKRWICEYYY